MREPVVDWTTSQVLSFLLNGTVHLFGKLNSIFAVDSETNSLTFQRQLWPEKQPIFRSKFDRKSKIDTNQQRIGCLVYPEITQISERSLEKDNNISHIL